MHQYGAVQPTHTHEVDQAGAVPQETPPARGMPKGRHNDAASFWLNDVLPEVAAGRRVMFGAERGDTMVGTVQLLTAMPPNQQHRCEVAKMIVHPSARRLGVGRCLVARAIEHARELGKTLITLDTRTGDAAELLYTSAGFEVAGISSDFAWDPDGQARHATTYMFRRI